MKSNKISFQKIKQNELMNLAKFVVTENFSHHTSDSELNEYDHEIQSIYDEEVMYAKNSEIIAATDGPGILGTIRIIKWDKKVKLPIEKMFNIHPMTFLNDGLGDVFHIGRFTIKKGIRDVVLLKKLIVCAISSICSFEKNIAFAECDSKLLKILSMLGIRTKVIGESIHYLGSETIPISMSYSGLIEFYNENLSLVPNHVLKQFGHGGYHTKG